MSEETLKEVQATDAVAPTATVEQKQEVVKPETAKNAQTNEKVSVAETQKLTIPDETLAEITKDATIEQLKEIIRKKEQAALKPATPKELFKWFSTHSIEPISDSNLDELDEKNPATYNNSVLVTVIDRKCPYALGDYAKVVEIPHMHYTEKVLSMSVAYKGEIIKFRSSGCSPYGEYVDEFISRYM